MHAAVGKNWSEMTVALRLCHDGVLLKVWPGEHTLKTIFDLCEPRKDVVRGEIAGSDFAADLAQVIKGTARNLMASSRYGKIPTGPCRIIGFFEKNTGLKLQRL